MFFSQLCTYSRNSVSQNKGGWGRFGQPTFWIGIGLLVPVSVPPKSVLKTEYFGAHFEKITTFNDFSYIKHNVLK